MVDYAEMNQLLFEGKHKIVKQMTEDALAEGRPVAEVLEDGLIAGMRVIGEDFKHNRIFVRRCCTALAERENRLLWWPRYVRP